MKLVLLGAPGSGKGTLAKGLIKAYDIPSISTGDLLRNSIASGTKVGKEAKKYMDEGKLVPTEIVIKMLKERLANKDTKNGYILDGFPRSLEQAELLEEFADIDKCLYLDVDRNVIIDRLAGRRTCDKCGEIYNTRTYAKNTCKCGGKLYMRDDDKPETVAKRFDTFSAQTEPLVEYYKRKGILKTIKVKGEVDPNETLQSALEMLK